MSLRAMFTLFLILACTTTAHGLEDPPTEARDFDNLSTYYYLEKDLNAIPGYLKWLQDSKMLDENESAVEPSAAFLAVIFSENPKKVTHLAKSASFTGKTKEMIELALWLSGNSKKIDKIFGETPDFAKAKWVSLTKRPIKGPGDLDMMWGSFFASGDVTYVKRIIDVLDEDYLLSGDTKADLLTRGAAEWSLKSNMMQHELVFRLIRGEAASRTGTAKNKLRKMLDSIKKVSLPDKDGDFSAQLLIMDQKGLDEFNKAVDEPLKLSHKPTARRGDVMGIKLVFAGIELTDDLNANVTYDLKVLDPEGKIYDETDLTGLEALKKKVPTRFRFFDNQQVPMIRFEPKDKLGAYKINAKIHDKIGGKAISLKCEIELKK